MDNVYNAQSFCRNYFRPFGHTSWNEKLPEEKCCTGLHIVSYFSVAAPVLAGVGYALTSGVARVVRGRNAPGLPEIEPTVVVPEKKEKKNKHVAFADYVDVRAGNEEIERAAVQKHRNYGTWLAKCRPSVNVRELDDGGSPLEVRVDDPGSMAAPAAAHDFYEAKDEGVRRPVTYIEGFVMTDSVAWQTQLQSGPTSEMQVSRSYHDAGVERYRSQVALAKAQLKSPFVFYREQGSADLAALTIAFQRAIPREADFLVGIFQDLVNRFSEQIEAGQIDTEQALQQFGGQFFTEARRRNNETIEFDQRSFWEWSQKITKEVYSETRVRYLTQELQNGDWKRGETRTVHIQHFSERTLDYCYDNIFRGKPDLRGAVKAYFQRADQDRIARQQAPVHHQAAGPQQADDQTLDV